ncbi:hypothetical protein LshimejAT787_0301720 [Lyophyllum shimeji]|uniref:Uncharacterized protein n=1 Tax=Lyophyllum shimeji TaxID=47721 RepID=A0A9P3PI53_LYOSH|nr:hypothetical protein LshimejAT787_0301720 [Lyophyllum shimeji]
MLHSWFGTKDDDKANIPGGPDTHAAETLDDSQKPARQTPPTGFTSPHDAVLARLHSQLLPEGVDDDGVTRDNTPTPQNHDRRNGSTPTPSTPHDPNTAKETLYDPYDGTPIGTFVPHHLDPKGTGRAGVSSSRRSESGNKEEQWAHLSRVLDLQNEVAKMHLEMEGVGPSDGKGKGRGRGKGKGLGDAKTREKQGWADSVSEVKPKRRGTGDSIGTDPHDGDEEGVSAAGDEEIEMKKAREEQFANLPEQFEGRKESIQEIMDKLDHLSKALTEFHTLQAPTFEFTKTNSRQNSVTPDRTPPQIQTQAPPYASATLPNAGLTNLPNANLLRAVQSSRGSSTTALPSAPEQERSGIPASFSRSTGPAKARTPASSLLVNALEPGKQAHVMDSPDSMKGHMQLAPES